MKIHAVILKVTTLPVGQVLDLWKTFEYHLKNVSNGGNKLIDQLMSTFILHACIVEQAIPEPTMDKIEANIKVARELSTGTGSHFPKLENSLNEICILLRLRNSAVDLVTEMMTKKSSLTHLQKRKLENSDIIDNFDVKSAKMDFTWNDIKRYPTNSWKSMLPDLSDTQIDIALDEIIKKESYQVIRGLVEEDIRIQKNLLTKVIKEMSCRNSSKFLKLLQR